MNQRKRSSSFSLSFLSALLLLFAAAAMMLSAYMIYQAEFSVRLQSELEQLRGECEVRSQELARVSEYLAGEVRQFIAGHDASHLYHYREAVNEGHNRGKAVSELAILAMTPEEDALIQAAGKEADRLMEGEARAMRLTAEALGLSETGLPAAIASVQLTGEEKTLSRNAKLDLALDYLTGEEYACSKAAVSSNISGFRRLLLERTGTALELASSRIQLALMISLFCGAAMLLCLTLSHLLLRRLSMRPLKQYAAMLRDSGTAGNIRLTPTGSREIREFAEAYNIMHADWEQQKNRLEEERFRFHTAVENSHIIIYEYQPAIDTYTAYGTLNIPELESHYPGVERTIHDFMNKYAAEILDAPNLAIMKRLVEQQNGVVEMQILSPQNRPVWIRVTAASMSVPDDCPIKIIGKITNIQSEKEKEFALAEANSRDCLTGLYNRETGLRKIQKIMSEKSPDEICGMMMLDMDDFDGINEAEGSVFADAILQDVADILRAKTGPEDILTRLGGDEFLLFIRNCPKSRATVLGPEIAEQIRALTPENGGKAAVSASIGMCVTEVTDEYSSLYRCAESTLNYVKSAGKGRAACYLDTSVELGTMLTQAYPENRLINTIERPGSCSEDLISFALELLGKARNLSNAVDLLLSRAGRQCRLDRVTIAEVSSEYLSCHISFQWCRTLSENHTGETHYLDKEALRGLVESYKGDETSEYGGIPFLTDMKSLIHAAIYDQGLYYGFMSFERQAPGCLWTAEERHLLCELAKIISSFVMKARADAVSRAKTDFLSRMSHEIRTPMNAITGMTAIAKSCLADPERTLDCLNKIESANAYLLSLINDILDMSRIESGKMELSTVPVDLSALTENVDLFIRPQAQRSGLKLETAGNFPHPLPVLADALHLNQILINLLGNAVKFTPAGGTVTLDAQMLSRDQAHTTIRFTVSDTGIGISQEAQDRIFNAFEQAAANTAAAYGGTGLGLSISASLVKMMGGTLTVNSRPGEGSTFSFAITLKNTAADQLPETTETEEALQADDRLKGKRVLLAEDNELNREIAVEILSMNGFQVETAPDGAEAVKLFSIQPQGWYDAILMDIRMPVMDGMEATRRIRTLGKPDSRTIPIIAMTANAFDEDMKKSLENGMDDHLSKPIDVNKLLNVLRKCISHERD